MTKADLHRLIDELPEKEVLPAHRFLEYLNSRALDPAIRIHMEAESSRMELTPEENASLDEAWEEYRQGEVFSAEEARRELLS